MKPCLNMGDHPRLNTDRPIVNQYREGKAKRTERSEIEPETVCVQAVGAPQGVTAYLCIMGQRLTVRGKLNRIGRRRETESDKGA